MESKTSFGDSSESDKESRPKKKVPTPTMQKEFESMERRQLAKKEAKEVSLKVKKKRRNHKAAAKARANALALVTDSVAAQEAPKEAMPVMESIHAVQDPGQATEQMFFAQAQMYLKESLYDLVLACLSTSRKRQIVTCFKEETIGNCLERIDNEHFGYESLEQLDFLHVPIFVGLKVPLRSVFHKSWDEYNY